MLLLPQATHPRPGRLLTLASTLAGNLLLVGFDRQPHRGRAGSRVGVRIGWREHARVGVPVTVLTLAFAAAWLLYAPCERS